MTGQLELLCGCRQPKTIGERFDHFHRDNPHVYAELVKMARRARGRGHQRIGIKMLWEVVRWNLSIETNASDEWKLNNDFTSHYARLLMKQERDLADVFEIRTLRAS